MTDGVVKLSFLLGGMRCEQCVRTIEVAVNTLPGVRHCTVRIGQADIAFDECLTNKADLIAAIHRAGPFEVTGFGDSK